MERSAIYRRALAPIVLSLGVLGVTAAVMGWLLELTTPGRFVSYWAAVGLIGVSGAYALARQQALKAGESFWSAPTRRVTQALLPPLFVGFVATATTAWCGAEVKWITWLLVPLWMVLYGCALHAAGFFMPRGMKLFGWGFILGGSMTGALLCFNGPSFPTAWAHLVMGLSFGGFHLGYGLYLYFTEKRKNET
jgi:hypothetical protein